MYLSFISDEVDKLEARLSELKDLGARLESDCDDIVYELREQMRESVMEKIDQAFEDTGIEDNAYDEKAQEAIDEMTQYIEQNL